MRTKWLWDWPFTALGVTCPDSSQESSSHWFLASGVMTLSWQSSDSFTVFKIGWCSAAWVLLLPECWSPPPLACQGPLNSGHCAWPKQRPPLSCLHPVTIWFQTDQSIIKGTVWWVAHTCGVGHRPLNIMPSGLWTWRRHWRSVLARKPSCCIRLDTAW